MTTSEISLKERFVLTPIHNLVLTGTLPPSFGDSAWREPLTGEQLFVPIAHDQDLTPGDGGTAYRVLIEFAEADRNESEEPVLQPEPPVAARRQVERPACNIGPQTASVPLDHRRAELGLTQLGMPLSL